MTNSLVYLSSVDRILMMKDGKITENGTWEELLHDNGDFANFVRTYLMMEESTEDVDG